MSLHAQHLPFLLESEAQDNKLCQPKKVTSNRKGPLCLSSESSIMRKERVEGMWQLNKEPRAHQSARSPSHHHNIQTHKQKSLTRVPIILQERPMELLEKELGTMSCAQLKNSIQSWLPHHLRCIHLPRVPLLLQHLIPAAAQQPSAQHQHKDTSPHTSINVTITYNMHDQHLPKVFPYSSRQQLTTSPQPQPTTSVSSQSQHHTPGPHPHHKQPRHSLCVPKFNQGLPELFTEPLDHSHRSGRGRVRNRGRSHHTHKLQPLLSKITVLPGQCLSIAQQATLNSSRTERPHRLAPNQPSSTTSTN